MTLEELEREHAKQKAAAAQGRLDRSDSGLLGSMLSDVAEVERPPVRSYSTGMAELDRLLGGGISTRQLTTVFGPPAAGKTAWAVAMALRIQAEIPVLYISSELESDELLARVAAIKLGCAWRDIVRGKVDRAKVREAVAGLRIRVVGCDTVPRDNLGTAIEAVVRAMTAAYGVAPLVVLDYVQDLVRGEDERTLRARVGDLVTGLRAVAQELDFAIVAVSSVSRAYYSARKQDELRSAKDPTVYLAAAKESGDVEYVAAVVLFLDVEPAGAPGVHRLAQVAVAKSRHGETGFAGARFYGASGRWEADAGAVEAMGDEARAEARHGDRMQKQDAKLIATIRKFPALAWKNLRASCGISPYADADATRDRLVADGKIAVLPEDYFDGLGRQRKRNVWRVVGDAPPPDSLDATAARFGITRG